MNVSWQWDLQQQIHNPFWGFIASVLFSYIKLHILSYRIVTSDWPNENMISKLSGFCESGRNTRINVKLNDIWNQCNVSGLWGIIDKAVSYLFCSISLQFYTKLTVHLYWRCLDVTQCRIYRVPSEVWTHCSVVIFVAWKKITNH